MIRLLKLNKYKDSRGYNPKGSNKSMNDPTSYLINWMQKKGLLNNV